MVQIGNATMDKGFCPFCGASMAGLKGRETCKPSHTRKLRGVCDEIGRRMESAVLSTTEGHDPGFPLSARRFRDMAWCRLARPISSPECSLAGIGNARAVALLTFLYLYPNTAPEGLDGDLYGRLAANGWVDFSPSVYQHLQTMAKATA